MPLNDREQKILDEIERQFLQDDPKLAKAVHCVPGDIWIGRSVESKHGMANMANKGTFRPIPMIGGHAALAALLFARFRNLNPDSMASVKLYYKHIWDLFYLEYGLYTLI